MRQNLSSVLTTKQDKNLSPQIKRLISAVASIDMILSKTQIMKALINLCGCTGWSAPMFFANTGTETGFLCHKSTDNFYVSDKCDYESYI